MNQDLFKNLPSDVTINVLSRLPVRAVVTCKFVCKPWLRLLKTPDFIKYHLSKSVPALFVFDLEAKVHRILDFDDGLGLKRNELHYNPVAKFKLPFKRKIHGSVNGLLLLRDKSLKPDGLFICNPITRDYIKLDCPQEFVISDPESLVAAYGFGVSKKSCVYKVVRISQEWVKQGDLGYKVSLPEFHVYTLGTGSWRKIQPVGPDFIYGKPNHFFTRTTGPYLDGKLHWLVSYKLDGDTFPMICIFDLESETHRLMSTPLPPMEYSIDATISVFDGCLCCCDSTSKAEIVIYMLELIGDESFWVKTVVMLKDPEFFPFNIQVGLKSAIKIFSDGDVLLEWEDTFLFHYSEKKKTKTFEKAWNKTETFEMFNCWQDSILLTPSFVSLKSFEGENANTF